MAQTSERGFRANAHEVMPILAGRQSQFRRIMKPQPADHAILPHNWGEVFFRRKDLDIYGGDGTRWGNVPMADGTWGEICCPYGQPGDRLWGRETFCGYCEDSIVYRATVRDDTDWTEDEIAETRWRPSIHMPRWASRIMLEVTSVRVERLQGISEADAMAEGAGPFMKPVHPARESLRHVDGFRLLWESIHGAGCWDANPWLWVVEFKRIAP